MAGPCINYVLLGTGVWTAVFMHLDICIGWHRHRHLTSWDYNTQMSAFFKWTAISFTPWLTDRAYHEWCLWNYSHTSITAHAQSLQAFPLHWPMVKLSQGQIFALIGPCFAAAHPEMNSVNQISAMCSVVPVWSHIRQQSCTRLTCLSVHTTSFTVLVQNDDITVYITGVYQ